MKGILFGIRASNKIKSRASAGARAAIATGATGAMLYSVSGNEPVHESQDTTTNTAFTTMHEVRPIVTSPVKPKTKERLLVKLIREIATELGLELETDSHDWIITLKNPKTMQTQHVMGYSFGLNSQVAACCVMIKQL